jgi:putative acetyltransferase
MAPACGLSQTALAPAADAGRLCEKSILKIRHSAESDRTAIDGIHTSAFGQQQGQEIVELVNDLLDDDTAKPLLSLVAETDGKLVGHILFTVAQLQPKDQAVSIRILAPLAVLSDFQGQGVGAVLIKEGLKELAESGVGLVFVLGHPGYYPKFGFQTAGLLGFQAPYPIPSEHADAWMVQELIAGVIGSIEGRVQCSKILNQPQHWRG